jgi:hypothetical protein
VRARGARPKGWLAAARRSARERAIWPLLVALAANVSACGGSDAPELREYPDVGQFCLRSSAGLRLVFGVHTTDACLSACDDNRLSCSATLDGTRIELQTLLTTQDIPGVEICTTDCRGASGTCSLDVPAPGTYEFGFASRYDTSTLPMAGSLPLFGDHECDAAMPLLPNPPPSPPPRTAPMPEFEGRL